MCLILSPVTHIQIIEKSKHQYQNKITIITVHPNIILQTMDKVMDKAKDKAKVMGKAKVNRKIHGWEVKKEKAFTDKNTINTRSRRF